MWRTLQLSCQTRSTHPLGSPPPPFDCYTDINIFCRVPLLFKPVIKTLTLGYAWQHPPTPDIHFCFFARLVRYLHDASHLLGHVPSTCKCFAWYGMLSFYITLVHQPRLRESIYRVRGAKWAKIFANFKICAYFSIWNTKSRKETPTNWYSCGERRDGSVSTLEQTLLSDSGALQHSGSHSSSIQVYCLYRQCM